MLGGVGVAGAEQHREHRHRQLPRTARCRRTPAAARPGAGMRLRQDGLQRRRDRLELQRDVGDRADDGDQRHRRRHRLALAVARGDEVGDRGDVLRLGEPHDAHDQRRAEPDHQDRPDIDSEEIVAGARGRADRAEERPRGAIDRERQRIDQRAARGPRARSGGSGRRSSRPGTGGRYSRGRRR